MTTAKEEHSVKWLQNKRGTFETEWTRIKNDLNAQFNVRGKNIAMECLQFGGNSEFWQDFPDEQEIASYFFKCYAYAIRYVCYKSRIQNIICALTVTEPNRRNLFIYYLPITPKWRVKAMSKNKSENGNRLQLRDEYDEPIYLKISNDDKPLLCHSEFWKQRGDLTSYSDLQEDFYENMSKQYGAIRGESESFVKNTNLEQRKRFCRAKGDDNDLLPPLKYFRE